MRVPTRTPLRPAESLDRVPSVTSDQPTPGEVLTEIGILLAIHLAVAMAVALTLRAFGIA